MRKQVIGWIARYRHSWTIASDTFRLVLATILASISQMVLVFLLVDVLGWLPEETRSRPVDLFIWYFLFCVTYVALCQITFGKLNSDELRTSLQKTKPTTRGSFQSFIYGESGTSHATMFSLMALAGIGIVAVGPGVDTDVRQDSIVYASALLTVIGSWVSNVVSFALQYARDDANGDQSDFRFPDEVRPAWSDYLYTAIMVSATLSTADVDVVSRGRRRMVSIHTVIAFTFNTVIIAMLVATIM